MFCQLQRMLLVQLYRGCASSSIHFSAKNAASIKPELILIHVEGTNITSVHKNDSLIPPQCIPKSRIRQHKAFIFHFNGRSMYLTDIIGLDPLEIMKMKGISVHEAGLFSSHSSPKSSQNASSGIKEIPMNSLGS